MAKTNKAPRAIEAEPETPVLFRADRENGETYITAVFPCEPATMSGDTMSCYAHVGQHSGCSFGWYQRTRAATEAEYYDLFLELQNIGYRLKVYRRMTRGHRAAFDAEVRRLNTRGRT